MALVQTCTGKWISDDEVKAIDVDRSSVVLEYFGDEVVYVHCQSEFHSVEERDRLARVLNGDEPEKAEA